MSGTARVVVVAAVVSLLACATTSPTEGRIATGVWGGDRLRVDVTPGGATTEYGCAHGTIDEPLAPDRSGRFSAMGTHTFEHGGPIRIDESPDHHPARYDGVVAGDTLQLTVTLLDTQQSLGGFTVVRGVGARLVKCL
jgi:hypothetical protein